MRHKGSAQQLPAESFVAAKKWKSDTDEIKKEEKPRRRRHYFLSLSLSQ